MKRFIFLSIALAVSTMVVPSARAEVVAVGSTGAFNEAFSSLPEGYAQLTRNHTGTATGLERLCDAATSTPPDVVFAIRAMKSNEQEKCASLKINEDPLGRYGLVLLTAQDGVFASISREELFLALASKAPDPADPKTLIRNPYRKWRDINPKLPDVPIKIVGPSRNIYAWTTFVNETVRFGCNQFEAFKDLERQDYQAYVRACGDVRQDGLYEEIGRAFTPAQLKSSHPTALLVTSVLAPISPMASPMATDGATIAADGFTGVAVNGVAPSPKSIADGSYPVGISLLVYTRKTVVDSKPEVKKLIDGLKESARQSGVKHFKGVY